VVPEVVQTRLAPLHAGSGSVRRVERYEVTHLDELARIPVHEGLEWRPIRRRLGIQSFGTNAYTSSHVGGVVVEEHKETSGHQELYVVVSGRARFTFDNDELDAPAGTLVFIPSGEVLRKAVSEEEGTTVLTVGGWPDRPFEPSAWEWFFEAYGQAPEEGVATMEEAADRFRGKPQEAIVLYHLACMESRAGRADEARVHIGRALELRPELRNQAQDDDDVKQLL
jgi:mannose-6-phosphate isomerase-like protein (cupin superfamily)